MSTSIDQYISKLAIWQEETQALRHILLEYKLEEELKWGKPCFLHQGSNIAVIQPFKKYFALLFFKGYLLKDPKNLLVKTGPNTKVGRQLRFESTAEIKKMKPAIEAFVREAAAFVGERK